MAPRTGLLEVTTDEEATTDKVFDPIRSFERIELPVGSYVKLAQIRGERNPVTNELKASIMAQGLLYEPISAAMSEELFTEYIEFVNKLWGSESSVQDFTEFRQGDGTYYMIVAGHSRHQAFEELMAEGRLLDSQTLPTKTVVVKSVWDIIALQRADNIHSAPPKERNAMATIEAYEWGLKKEHWTSIAQFVRHKKEQGERISTNSMREMKSFSKLPGLIRTFVLSGNVPYSVGIEMGKGVDSIRRYYALEAGYSSYDDEDMTPEHKRQIDGLVATRLNIDCVRMARIAEGGKFTVAAGKSLVRSTVENYRERADALDTTAPSRAVNEQLFQLEDPLDMMFEEHRRELDDQLDALIRGGRYSKVGFLKNQLAGDVSLKKIDELAGSMIQQGLEAKQLRQEINRKNLAGLGLAVAELSEAG